MENDNSPKETPTSFSISFAKSQQQKKNAPAVSEENKDSKRDEPDFVTGINEEGIVR